MLVLRQSRIRALQLTGDIDISVRNDFYAALESLADADLAVIDVGEIGYFDLEVTPSGAGHLISEMKVSNEKTIPAGQAGA